MASSANHQQEKQLPHQAVITMSNGIVAATEDELQKLNEQDGSGEEGDNNRDDGGKKQKIRWPIPWRRSQNGSSSVDYARFLKYTSLVVLVAQNTSQVLVMRFALTRDKNEHPPFLKTVVVFFNEVVKLIAALALFFLSTGDFRRSCSLLCHHFVYNFLDTLKVGVPALIYLIQNLLLYVAVANLDAATFMVTYQMKILTTAMFTVLMLKRKLSIQQWVALLVLIAGVAIVQFSAQQPKKDASVPLIGNFTNFTGTPATALSSSSTTASMKEGNGSSIVGINGTGLASKKDDGQSPLLGFAMVIIACFLSGFAGIYFEKILKTSDVSIWLRNTQLAALSIPLGLIVVAIKDGQAVMTDGFMQGFDVIVWVAVLLQAIGGLVVAVVIKYADNILKAFATSVSIVVATIASIFIFTIIPSLLFIGGAALVIGAVVLYGAFPYRNKSNEDGTEKNDDTANKNDDENNNNDDDDDNDGEKKKKSTTAIMMAAEADAVVPDPRKNAEKITEEAAEKAAGSGNSQEK